MLDCLHLLPYAGRCDERKCSIYLKLDVFRSHAYALGESPPQYLNRVKHLILSGMRRYDANKQSPALIFTTQNDVPVSSSLLTSMYVRKPR
jgi:hypothetical protein